MRLEPALHEVYNLIDGAATNTEGCLASIVDSWVHIEVPIHAMITPFSLRLIPRALLLLAGVFGRSTPLFYSHSWVVEWFKASIECVGVGRRFLNLLCLGKQFWPEGYSEAH